MPASHAYPPYIEGIIFDATGKPAAGGTVEAYVAGTSVPTPLWSTSEPATSLGPVVTIDGAGRAAFRLREGYAYKLRAKDADGALIWERDNVKCPLDGGGVNIPNPMESTGDMIVGGVDGQPERLAPGDEGDALQIVSGVPTYAPVTGDHKVLASATDSTAAGTLNEKVLAIYPLKKSTTTTGSPATEKLNIALNTSDDVSSVGDVLTRTAGGADWAAIPTQTGDHKTAVDGSDTSPDYLAAKLAAGSGISLTNTGSAVSIAADAQSGDHHVLVTNADASAGTLADKLVAGSNVTLTPQTDGDGVQTLEISATGGGGGGGGAKRQTLVRAFGVYDENLSAENSGRLYSYMFVPAFDTITGFGLMFGSYANKTPNVLDVAIYEGDAVGTATKISSFTRTSKTVSEYKYQYWDFDAPVSIDITKNHWIGVCCSSPRSGTRGANIGGEEAFIQNMTTWQIQLGGNYKDMNATPANLPTSGVSSIRFRPSVILIGQ